MALFHDSAIAGASGQAAGGAYKIERSLRFNSSDSAYLSRTPASAGNRKTWTWSGWVKRSRLSGSDDALFIASGGSGLANAGIDLSSDQIRVVDYNGSSIVWRVQTSAVLRDASAWYHIVVSVDTTQSTASDRVKIWINGILQTAFANASYPSQNVDSYVNNTQVHYIGANISVSTASLYLADIHFIDGQALTPSSFAETNITTGQWVPKAYTGTYGTNGFRLAFADNSNNTATTLGKDSSPNGHNWTPNNLSVLSGGPTSVVAASGALPIYNTTDTYGTVKGSGTRTDSNSSSIVLAIPMDGANNGTTFTDESATIKGSGSAKSITRNGDTKTSTTQSKFYGSSGFFDGSGDYLNVGSSSDYLFGTGDFTIESWFYLTSNSGRQDLCGNYSGGTTGWGVSFGNVSTGIYFYYGNNVYAQTSSNIWPVNRWNHVAIVRSSSVLRIYLNGVQVSSETMAVNISTTSYSTLVGAVTDFAGNPQLLINGYLQDFRIYKGVAKYTRNFNPPSSTQNPTVAAGNDSLVDTPTSYGTDTGAGGEVRGNYCTLNPLGTAGATPTNGNLSVSSGSTVGNRISTFFLTSGKWYWEGSGNGYVGAIVGRGGEGFTGSISATGSKAIGWWEGGPVYWDGGDNGGGTTFTSTDVIGIALDMDAGNVKFYKNNSLIYTITFGSGTVPNLSSGVFPAYNIGLSPKSVDLNFGQRPFAYTAPSGFKALCDTNLPAPVVAKPNTAFDVKLYTGNGSSQTISGLGFSPDLVWIKDRNTGFYHNILDTIRGGNARLSSNVTDAENTGSAGGATPLISTFNSDGFTFPNGNFNTNATSTTYVAWTWDAGSSTVTNTQGSITSQVRANASAGFSIVSYASGAVGQKTVGHGLNVAPSFIITKSRTSATFNWVVYHASVTDTTSKYLRLNTTDTVLTFSTVWGAALPTSTVFGITSDGAVVANTDCIAYCFAPVAGYSSFGSYTGNGSADGPFVYTGFRPRWLLIKVSSTTGDWILFDSARATYNSVGPYLFPNTAGAENSTGVANDLLDMYSNGFKLRGNYANTNQSSSTYVYAAFAESPLQYARAR